MNEQTWRKQRLEHETGLAASVFCEPELLVKLGAIVPDDAFRDRFLGQIFSTGVALYTAGKLTAGTLRGHLRAAGFLSTEGEIMAYRVLKDAIASQAEWHCHELCRMYALEKLQVLLANAHSEAQALMADPQELRTRVANGMEAISVDESDLWETAGEVTYRVFKKHKAHLQEGHGQTLGLSTGIKQLDTYTGGYFPQQLWQIAARSYYGKTAFLLELAKRLINRPQRAGIYIATYEMSNDELAERMYSSALGIPLTKFTRGELDAQEIVEMLDQASNFSDIPILFDEHPPATVPALTARLKLAMQERDIRILMVDHIQQIPMSKGIKRHEHLAQLARDFKRMAKDLGITVIILNQLNAEAEKPVDSGGRVKKSGASYIKPIEKPEPTNLHFSEGKQVLESLDVSLLLHRVDETASDLKVIISKNKKGQKASFHMHFDGAVQRIKDYEGDGGEIQ